MTVLSLAKLRQYVNFQSVSPLSYKKSVVEPLLLEAMDYCASEEFLTKKVDLIANDYPEKLLNLLYNLNERDITVKYLCIICRKSINISYFYFEILTLNMFHLFSCMKHEKSV